MKGVGKGNTNNPNGRPNGAIQKITLSVRERIVEQIQNDFSKYFTELNQLQGKDYVRCMTELLKLVIPRPLNEEESNAINMSSEIIKRLFNK